MQTWDAITSRRNVRSLALTRHWPAQNWANSSRVAAVSG